MKLFEINFEIEKLFDEETGEIFDIEALEKLEMARDEKVRNIIALYKNMKAEADALKTAKAELAKRQSAKEKSAQRLLEYLDSCMNGCPFECVEGRLSYRKSQATECVDEEAFLGWEGRFAYGKAELVPDKDSIKKAIKLGEEIPGWAVVEHNNASIK